ncbi:MAG: HD domain-containing protein [Peptococcaceae bacterium]|nr:HD domain-containing protein [Peptococcaceae bacterium]
MGDLLKSMKESWPALFLHSANVANLCLKICTFLRLDEVERKTLISGALFHDVGKMFIRSDIIDKPGPLTEEEWAELKEHSWRGASLVAERGGDESLVEIIRYHHERWDGKGYEGLWGQRIPWRALVIALADALDAMISLRPYRLPLKMYEALEEVYQGAGSQFDPELVAALAEDPFWQAATYRDPARLERQIDEEKQWLLQLADSYDTLSHPLVYAQSQWLDRLLLILWQLKGYATGRG